METLKSLEGAHDPLLFTPGPLTTSRKVKSALTRDLGSRDQEFLDLTQNIRDRLLKVAGGTQNFTTVLLPGSGTYSVESVLTSALPEKSKVLVLANGAYGTRMAKILKQARVPHQLLQYDEDQTPTAQDVSRALANDPSIEMVATVHCETTSGIFNPIEAIGQVVKRAAKLFFVDAMSSFGAYPFDLDSSNIDYLVTSSNKCLEGVPGMGIIFARRAVLAASEGFARSLSLDLFDQWKALETAKEFRFTPTVQVLLGLDQALRELEDEGGVNQRMKRYQENHRTLMVGMAEMGFKTYLKPEECGYIITSFHYKDHPRFDYPQFYSSLRSMGFVIYSGKVTSSPCFRIGHIGRVFPADVRALLGAMEMALKQMEVPCT